MFGPINLRKNTQREHTRSSVCIHIGMDVPAFHACMLSMIAHVRVFFARWVSGWNATAIRLRIGVRNPLSRISRKPALVHGGRI